VIEANGEFMPKWSEDILSKVLETKEPHGHARGIGNIVPHKRAWPCSEQEKAKMKMVRKEKKEDELENYYRIKFLPKVQSLIAEALAKQRAENDMRYKIEGAPSPIVPSPGPHKNSCASTVLKSQASPGDIGLKSLNLISRPMCCNLLATFNNDGGTPRVAATGQVFPRSDRDMGTTCLCNQVL
jgi:hypothetical protein